MWQITGKQAATLLLALLILGLGLSCKAEIKVKKSFHEAEDGPEYVDENYISNGPILNFSDIVSGPAAGLNDGLGVGAIVTIWGNNLGAIQGDSKIYFKTSSGEVKLPAHIYYWKNADGALPGGPANLSRFHHMQEIAFSIPSASMGAGEIYVVVDGQQSNHLSFTVTAGRIFYVSGNGDNSLGDGSFSNPWLGFGYPSGASTKGVLPGDIIYGRDVTESGVVALRATDGSINAPIAMIGYPGTFLRIRNIATQTGAGGVSVWSIVDRPEYWVVSKWDIEVGGGSGIVPTRGGRVIGNAVTDTDGGAGCADGGSGAISAGGDQEGAQIFGNYIHGFGCITTSNQHHTFYFSVRNKGRDISPVDIGWNLLLDNWARGGIHFYDEHDCWGYNGISKIHHNVVKNQVGASFNVGGWICDAGRLITGDFDVYNNLFIEGGKFGNSIDTKALVYIQGDDVVGHFRIYNNTFYGYGWDGADNDGYEGALIVPGEGYPTTDRILTGSYEWKNNIVVDTHNYSFFGARIKTPSAASNNLWFSLGGNHSLPDWENSAIVLNPLFRSVAEDDFTLLSASLARDNGVDLSGIVDSDLFNNSRDDSFDIGAISGH